MYVLAERKYCPAVWALLRRGRRRTHRTEHPIPQNPRMPSVFTADLPYRHEHASFGIGILGPLVVVSLGCCSHSWLQPPATGLHHCLYCTSKPCHFRKGKLRSSKADECLQFASLRRPRDRIMLCKFINLQLGEAER